jgi:hypothetical protein
MQCYKGFIALEKSVTLKDIYIAYKYSWISEEQYMFTQNNF